MTQPEVSNLSDLTQLLAAHGVYALTVIFIFYQQWRAYRNLTTAPPKHQDYFRKVHVSVIVATYTLATISTVVWVYATFFYSPRYFIRGAVTGLTEQTVSPKSMDDPPRVIQSIIPDTVNVDLYENRRNRDGSSRDGKYDLAWVLLPQDNVRSLVFRFQHHYEIAKAATLASEPLATPGKSGITIDSKTIPRRFQIDLKKLKFAKGDYIHLRYEGSDNAREIGRVFVQNNDTMTEIPWEKDTAQSTIAPSHAWFTLTALAAQAGSSPFKSDGSYDLHLGRALRARLGSNDLRTQIAARQVLVDGGKRSFKFMLESLGYKDEPGYDRQLLVHNVAEALERIESQGARPKDELVVGLAMAFYQMNDFESAARSFRKAGSNLVSKEQHFYRAFAYGRVGMHKESLVEYAKYLDSNPPAEARSMTFFNMGATYEDLQREADAIKHYERAIQLNPKNPNPLNNLAYLYAERGTRLPEALTMVNRALEIDPRNADFKDTKGWILYKMGNREAALPLLKEAAAGDPSSKVIREHVAVAEKRSR